MDCIIFPRECQDLIFLYLSDTLIVLRGVLMTKSAADQIARIIRAVFEHEESIDPRTVALLFEYIGRLTKDEGK